MDLLMEYEATGSITKKQRYLTDFTVITAVEQLVHAIEEVEGPGSNVRDNRRVRYLSQMKALCPKKDMYNVPKARGGGMRSIVTTKVSAE